MFVRDAGWQSWAPMGREISMVGFNFTNNVIDELNGTALLISSVGVSYVNCTFQDNQAKNAAREHGIMRFYNGIYSFSGCNFTGWNADTPILYVPDVVSITEFKLSKCIFEECTSTQVPGIFGSLQCPDVTIEGCRFID